ncbi:hypothetical protein DM860_015738 [Cuscuta australis]|uniref:Major facilitator superfamily (MFS) profile domain-containing protein n=1 Tax=Cuscuta australis TaxID=267555 RepID=A0A328DV02_9ASTE|nr:hypothetical protein DM860_015738 [Cuscuta australis]
MGEGEKLPVDREEDGGGEWRWGCIYAEPVRWLRMLAGETHWSFVFGVVVVYGISQGVGGAFGRVGTEYYMKDVQKVQPSEAQVYSGVTSIPWLVKPFWGILTDVVPILGYHRRPYFIFAGALGIVSMLFLSLHKNLHIVSALLSLTAGSAGVAIADVTIDACVAQNSGAHPSLAPDMQSLCALSASIGSLLGFSLSGISVRVLGPEGVYGLLAIPSGLVFLVGILLKEPEMHNAPYQRVSEKFGGAAKAMWKTLRCAAVWRPCLYMYLSLALSFDVSEGMFYWMTDAEGGPHFSKESIGYISAIGSIGSLLGAILYQYGLKDHPFRDLLFWTQLLYGLSGMLDLALILRLNLRFGIPDYFFVVIDSGISHMIGRLKWMPLLVLTAKLCPPGIEGTIFALLMSIDNSGLLTSSWGGGFLLHVLNVTRARFDKLWVALLIRNVLRVTPLFVLFLVPSSDPDSSILPTESGTHGSSTQNTNVELVSLVDSSRDTLLDNQASPH